MAFWDIALTLFGPFSVPVLVDGAIGGLGLALAAFFIYRYYKKFYVVAAPPLGWKMFYWGLILNAAVQFLEVPFTYRILSSDVALLFYLVFQTIAAAVLVYGLWLMRKEVQIIG